MRPLTAWLEDGYCSITIVNHPLITVIRFVAKNYAHPQKGFANKLHLVLHAEPRKCILECSGRNQTRPLHVECLLATLHRNANPNYVAADANRLNSDFVIFFINHPALLTFAERDRLYCMVDLMIRLLPPDENILVIKLLDVTAATTQYIWYSDVRQVRAFNDRYKTGDYHQLHGGYHFGV